MPFRQEIDANDRGQYIMKLLPRHFKILDLVIEGMTNGQIAAELEMSSQQVSNVINSPTFQHELALRRSKIEQVHDQTVVETTVERMKDVQKFIDDAASRAASTMAGLLTDNDPRIRHKSAADILDRAGYARVTKAENLNKHVVTVLTPEDLKRFQDTVALDKD